MSFKIIHSGSRIVKAKPICAAEQIVTLAVLLAILIAVSYPMYFYQVSVYLVAVISIKLIMAIVLLFDLSILARGLIKKTGSGW